MRKHSGLSVTLSSRNVFVWRETDASKRHILKAKALGKGINCKPGRACFRDPFLEEVQSPFAWGVCLKVTLLDEVKCAYTTLSIPESSTSAQSSVSGEEEHSHS